MVIPTGTHTDRHSRKTRNKRDHEAGGATAAQLFWKEKTRLMHSLPVGSKYEFSIYNERLGFTVMIDELSGAIIQHDSFMASIIHRSGCHFVLVLNMCGSSWVRKTAIKSIMRVILNCGLFIYVSNYHPVTKHLQRPHMCFSSDKSSSRTETGPGKKCHGE